MLLQVLTGEGKSSIVSSLAAILAISGRNVDVVTTSSILAERDVVEKRTFFELLGLEVAGNSSENQRGTKECYKGGKIVYGTPHTFQVDILLDEYKKLGLVAKISNPDGDASDKDIQAVLGKFTRPWAWAE